MSLCCIWHQVCWAIVKLFGNLQEGSTLPSRGNGCNVQIGQLQCELFSKSTYLPISRLHSSDQDAPLHVGLWGFSVQVSFWSMNRGRKRGVFSAVQEMDVHYPLFKCIKSWGYKSDTPTTENHKFGWESQKNTLTSKIWHSVSKKHVNPHISYGYWWYLMIHDFVGQRIQTSELQVGKTLNWNGDPGGKEKGQQQSLKNKLTTVNILTNKNIYSLFYYLLAKLWLTCSPLPPTASCRWRSRYPGPVWRWEGPGTPAGVSPSPPSAPGSPPQDGSLYLGNQWYPWRTGPPSHGAGVPETHSQRQDETDRAMNLLLLLGQLLSGSRLDNISD